MKRVGLELSVERATPSTDGRAPSIARLSVRFELNPADSRPSVDELHDALAELDRDLGEAVARLSRGSSQSADRPLAELIETYHPRQVELIELLRSDGELSDGEATALRRHLSPPVASAGEPPARLGTSVDTHPSRPIEGGAASIDDRIPPNPRSVEDLLDRVLSDVPRTGDQADLVLQRVAARREHLLCEIDGAVTGCLGSDQ